MDKKLVNIGKTPCFLAQNLSEIAEIKHGFLTRQGGVSLGDFSSLNCALPHMSKDEPEHIDKNMNIVSKSFAIAQSRLFCVKQVHGADVFHVKMGGAMSDEPEADAIITTQKGLALGIRTADCVPILLSTNEGDMVAAVHAGWQSTYKGIVQNVVDKMVSLGAVRNQISASVGPAIAEKSYEVGKELMQKFSQQNLEYSAYFSHSKRENHYMFNLSGLVAKLLYNNGIRNIEHLKIDAYTNENLFFSHRRMTHKKQLKTGRQLSVIMIAD